MFHNMPGEGQVADPFPRLIWKYHYDFDYETLKPKIDEAFSQVKTGLGSSLETGDSISSVAGLYDDRPHKWPELREFVEHLEPIFEFQWNYHRMIYPEKRIAESWFNRHRRGGVTLEHSHNGIGLVLAAYIKLPPNSGFIEFRDPLEYHKANSPIIPENELWKEIPCVTGDFLIFPGWLKHRTQISCTDDERIVMTFNIR
jgi:uncharacterized protein (TIGR02466 family)